MQQATCQKLLALHDKLFDLRQHETIIDFIVNDSHKIIPYQLSVIFDYNLQSPKNSKHIDIIAISGTIDKEINIDFKNWLNKTIDYLVQNHLSLQKTNSTEENNKTIVIHPDSIDSLIINDWAENLGQELLLVNLYIDQTQSTNLLIFNKEKYNDENLISFNFLTKSYKQALTINSQNKKQNKRKIFTLGLLFKIFIIGFIISLFFPVTPSVMAPAEIISEQSWAINAPVTGIIKNIAVEPNSIVKKDDLLFTFDQLDLANNLKLKQQELKSLETDQQQVRALGFDDKEQRGKIFRINQDITAKQQEVIYAQQQFNLSLVTAPNQGIVLFKSKNDFIGKPAKIGETIMRLADVNSKMVEIWLDVNNSMPLKKEMNIYYYSNKDPFSPILAKLNYYSYEAYITPQNKIAYRLLANIVATNDNLIIGDHGQVKIYGLQKTFFGKFLFQKPIATLRQWFYKAI